MCHQSITVTYSVVVQVRESTSEEEASRISSHSLLAIDALVSNGPQLQSIDSVTSRLTFVSQETGRDSTQSVTPIHTTTVRVLTPQIQFSGIKEKGSPSTKMDTLQRPICLRKDLMVKMMT